MAEDAMAESLAAAQDRSRLFWWLAEFLLKGPQRVPLPGEEEATPPGSASDDPLEPAWRNMLAALRGLSEATPESVAAEHTRLLAGLSEAGVPPPFESTWRPGVEAGAVQAAVVGTYAAAGFADIDLEAGPQDHLAVELKFVALLALREAEAWQQNAPEAAARRRQQIEFLDRHLDWVPRWAETLAQHGAAPAYAAYAELLGTALTQARTGL